MQFKEGDPVVVVYESKYHSSIVGAVGIVSAVFSDTFYVNWVSGAPRPYYFRHAHGDFVSLFSDKMFKRWKDAIPEER